MWGDKMKHWKCYLTTILVTLAIGALGGWVTSSGMETYETVVKPSLTPPSVVFPIVWNILYILMGIGLGRILVQCDAKKPLVLYGAQLAANFLWSVLFFGFQLYLPAFVWLLFLWCLILAMAKSFYAIDPLAGILQLPYLLWVGFAGYLNLMIWLLNG